MEFVITYIAPFIKNVVILDTTVFIVYLGSAIHGSGTAAFRLMKWLDENRDRFKAGALFILFLSALMALTDVSPLFQLFGFDINSTPIGLGLAIAVFLGFVSTAQGAGREMGMDADDH